MTPEVEQSVAGNQIVAELRIPNAKNDVVEERSGLLYIRRTA